MGAVVSGKGGGYEVHVLGDREEPETIRTFGHDGLKAVIFYMREVVVAQRRGLLLLGETLPGLEPEVIDSYSPPPVGSPEHHGRKIAVTLGDPQPAFPREQRMAGEVVPTNGAYPTASIERKVIESSKGIHHAALWYARGVIDALGPLSPFSHDNDPSLFADYHETTSAVNFQSIATSWEQWSSERREVTGK